MEPQALTVKQAAQYLGLDEMTVYKYIWSGRIKAAKPFGRWVIQRADLDALGLETYALPTDEENALVAAIRSIAHGDKYGPGGLEALAMSLCGEGLKDNVSKAIRDGLYEIANAIRERE